MPIVKRFKLKIAITFLAVCLICQLNLMAGEKDWTLSVKGIQIIDNGYESSSEKVMPFNQFKGTSVACLFRIKSSKIISFLDVKSNILEFKDNLGTDLIDPNERFGNGFGLAHQISRDGSALMFDINGSNLPKRGATSIIASGKIAINLASKISNVSIKDIVFAKETIIKTPAANLKIINIGKSSFGEHPYEVLFESSTDLSVIKNIQFTHLNGQPIESKSSGTGSHNIVGDLSSLKFERKYSISEKPAKVHMVINFWADMKTENIPFSFETSMGL